MDTPSFHIRKCNDNDRDQLANLFHEFYSVFNMEQTLRGAVKELLRVDDTRAFSVDSTQDYLTDEYVTYVAEKNNDELIGYICGTITKKEHYVYTPEAEIIDWYVSESSRGMGVGKQLYETFVDMAKEQGAKVIVVEAFSANKKTIQTYEDMGFVHDSVILKKII